MASHTGGQTYCLDAGTFSIRSTITTEDGDVIIGAGRDSTFIDGRSIPARNGRIFITQGHTTFMKLDISGARTPASESTECLNTSGGVAPTSCGKAFVNNGHLLTLRAIDCHHNGANCVAGSGSIRTRGLDCWRNGSRYSMRRGFAYAACIKIAASYTRGDGNLTLKNSYIHHQPDNGIWCDFCKYGSWVIEGNRFKKNGNHAIQWEMSGGWTAYDEAVVRNNIFRDNGWQTGRTGPGGVVVSTANDIVIADNTFRGHSANDAYAIYVLFGEGRNPPQPDARGVVIRDNTLNNDTISGCDITGVTCNNKLVSRSRAGDPSG